MNPKELRVGNLLKDEVGGAWLRVSEVTEKTTCVDVVDRDKFPLPEGWKAQGVPITVELLADLGFYWQKNDGWKGFRWKGDNGFVIASDNGFDFYLGFIIYDRTDYENLDTLAEISSFHQLQNLYFALTGEELDVSSLLSKNP